MESQSLANKLKLDFNLNIDLSDIIFIKGDIRKYNKSINNVFGEKLCLLYTVEFLIYNLPFSMKILAFVYENYSEILKLDIDLPNKNVEKEIAACRNFLQRHRNLNTAFSTLSQFAKFVETRRLISTIVMKKEPKIVLDNHDDGGITIKYLDNFSNILIGIYWKIEWNLKDSVVVDVIEVYYNNFVLPNGRDIKNELTALTHPSLDFQSKLRLWKLLMSDLKRNSSSNTIQAVITIRETNKVSEADSVLVISDNEEDKRASDVSKNKRRRIEPHVCSSSIVYVVPD